MAIKASAEQQAVLLDLQQHDTALIQHAHKRSVVPEIAVALELEAKLAGLELKIVAINTEISDLSLEQTKADNDVQQVVNRAKKDQERIDSGSVTSAKEIEALQHEIASLAKRQEELEEIELAVMIKLDDAREAKTQLEAQQSEVQSQLKAAVSKRDEAFHDIDTQVSKEISARGDVAARLDADLLALYDKIRTDLGGIGAALLHRGSCQGCHIALDATELDRIRHLDSDVIVRCEECRRILVRTAESGL